MSEEKKQSESVTDKLNASAEAQVDKAELFLEKVTTIGELHTERATLANKLGEMKTQAMVRRDENNEDFEKLIKEIEETMRGISSDITAFSPKSLDELREFKKAIKQRFVGVGDLYAKAYKEEASILPDELER